MYSQVLNKPRIVRQREIITSSFLANNTSCEVEARLQEVRDEAVRIAALHNYGEFVKYETILPEWQPYSRKLGGYKIFTNWEECFGAFEFIVTIIEK